MKNENKNPLNRIMSSLSRKRSRRLANPHKPLPDTYYKHAYLHKKVSHAVAIVAEMKKMSFKKAAEFLIAEGFSVVIGEELRNQHLDRQLAKETRIPQYRRPHAIKVLKGKNKEQGVNPKKYM